MKVFKYLLLALIINSVNSISYIRFNNKIKSTFHKDLKKNIKLIYKKIKNKKYLNINMTDNEIVDHICMIII